MKRLEVPDHDQSNAPTLFAIALVAVAAAGIMTPAAYHRQTRPREITKDFLTVCTRLLLWSMLPLAVGVCLDFYLVALTVLGSILSSVIASGLFFVFVTLWFVLPRVKALQSIISQGQAVEAVHETLQSTIAPRHP